MMNKITFDINNNKIFCHQVLLTVWEASKTAIWVSHYKGGHWVVEQYLFQFFHLIKEKLLTGVWKILQEWSKARYRFGITQDDVASRSMSRNTPKTTAQSPVYSLKYNDMHNENEHSAVGITHHLWLLTSEGGEFVPNFSFLNLNSLFVFFLLTYIITFIKDLKI